MRALMIGRFQPLHKGHMLVVEQAKKYELVVAIGSAYNSLSFDNPFTAGERYEMIHGAFSHDKIKNFFIVPIPDINRHGVYGKHIMDISPSFDIVFSNNIIVREIFEREGFTVKNTPLYNRDVYQGKSIRNKIAENKPWEDLVPKSVAEFIKKIKGDKRIQRLAAL